MTSPKIVVIGSCNIDFSSYVPFLPKLGETLYADKMVITHGGKGANQCVAAARLGASTALIGRLGGDSTGKHYLKDLQKNGVNTDFLTISEDICSGTAVITVAKNGDNNIVIVPGANSKVCKDDISKATSFIMNADVVVFQFETPIAATVEALQLLQKGKGKSIVNAAPALANPDGDVFKLSDIFCVNETEAEILTGVRVSSIDAAETVVYKLREKGCKVVVITLGAQGVVFATKEEPTPVHVPAKQVTAVDTTLLLPKDHFSSVYAAL
ncbi:ribokinase isoform X2 [Anabrus simplex]|uniref:ribokinase isoform X2 n=1 Tax=Anabrus simplex TaxID=316456 RepID=UPI0035A343CD